MLPTISDFAMLPADITNQSQHPSQLSSDVAPNPSQYIVPGSHDYLIRLGSENKTCLPFLDQSIP